MPALLKTFPGGKICFAACGKFMEQTLPFALPLGKYISIFLDIQHLSDVIIFI
jgi:hypothetical protein